MRKMLKTLSMAAALAAALLTSARAADAGRKAKPRPRVQIAILLDTSGSMSGLIEQAKSYGVKVIHHACGSVRDIISDLIDIGIDVLHPVQVSAAGMEPQGLKDDFGDKLSFCGGVDAQNLMLNGTPQQVKEKVFELKKIFPTGLIISPSNEAILPDTPPENVEAMFNAAKG